MQIQTCAGKWICSGAVMLCATVSLAAYLSQNLNSSRNQANREKALTTIAQHKLASTCRRSDGGSFQIGQVIEETGKTPTACYVNELGEYAFAGYLNNKLQVLQVLSSKEVNYKISELKNDKR